MSDRFFQFLEQNGGNNGGYGGYQSTRLASPGQIKYYYDLCERKRITPKDISKYTFDQLSKEIQTLRDMPQPASISQIEKIRELEKEIIDMGIDFKPSSEEFISKLTGGRDGTASKHIQNLFQYRQKLSDIAPPTEAQLNTLVGWFLCPDIPFEEFDINKRIDLGDGLWRFLTAEEFQEEIKSKMKRNEASRFIDNHRTKFYEWRKTRITQPQIEYIRELEERLQNTYVPKQVEYAVIDGVYTQITRTSSRNDYEPNGYNPMSLHELYQMSAEQASEWIDILRSDLERRTIDTMYNEEDVFGDYQDRLEKNRQVADETKAKEKALQEFQDLIYAIEAINGYKADEIHDLVNEVVVEVPNHEARDRIREFFLSTVTADRNKDEELWRSQMARIFNMCEENEYAMEILMNE